MRARSMYTNSERGQSLIELGLTLTFVLILLSGVVDIGRAFFNYMALRDAAQEGALYGSINPTDSNGIQERVRNSSSLLQGLFGDPAADTSIDINVDDPACTGNGIQVQVAYDNFPLTTPFLGSFLGQQTVAISASAVDTILNPTCP